MRAQGGLEAAGAGGRALGACTVSSATTGTGHEGVRPQIERPAAVLAPNLAAASVGGFLVLGLADGMLGVAWPAMRQTFAQPLAALGELLAAAVAGYLAATALAGPVLRRLGPRAALACSALLGATGAAAFAGSPVWALLPLAAGALGAAGGGVDAALNTVAALAGGPRLMNLLHGGYGVGAAFGPLVVTLALALASWRAAYGALLAGQLVGLGLWMALGRSFPDLPRGHQALRTPRRRALAAGIAAFALAAGVEVTAGSWAASFLGGPGGLGTAAAGTAVFAYWVGLAGGRFAAASLGGRLGPERSALFGATVAVGAAATLSVLRGPAATVIALVALGAALGPVFPALVSLTPGRLGEALAVDAVGWQLAGAGAGGAALSALAGLVLQGAGLMSFGPILVVETTVLLGVLLLGPGPYGPSRPKRRR